MLTKRLSPGPLTRSAYPSVGRTRVLWLLVWILLVGWILTAFVPELRNLVIVVEVAFALLHGSSRYGWRAIAWFLVPGFVISNVMENLSINTGFPFGHYHYTGGGKLFEVPWIIGPAYLATGYLAWVVATVIFGEVRQGAPWITTVGTPIVGAVSMTAWDLAIDPNASTINEAWIWRDGGGYFGVPFGNFLGWTLTVYLFMQIFALYLRTRGPLLRQEGTSRDASDIQGVLPYAATAVALLGNYFTAERKVVTDPSGTQWNTADIYETQALLTIYGMGFLALLALLLIVQRRANVPRP